MLTLQDGEQLRCTDMVAYWHRADLFKKGMCVRARACSAHISLEGRESNGRSACMHLCVCVYTSTPTQHKCEHSCMVAYVHVHVRYLGGSWI